MSKFHLLSEPWIPVVWSDGRRSELSLTDVLRHAPSIERLDVALPTEEAALYRLLLAVLHRALGGPTTEDDLHDLWERQAFPDDPLDRYFDRWSDRFWLFHDSAPFFQIADLPDDMAKPWVRLFVDGGSPTLFDHTTDENFPSATYAQAVRALLAHQSY